MSAQRALVIEDTTEVSALVSRILTEEGFEVHAAVRGDQGIALARQLDPTLIMLDLGLPGGDGVEVCREIRTFTDAYIIMLTGRSDEVDKLVGLSVGADDYMTKPFSPRELAARVRVLLRRPRVIPEGPEIRTFNELIVDSQGREATLRGQDLDLTKTEFDILDILTANPKRVYSRQQLLKGVWGEWYGDDHLIDVHVGNLRRKLGESAAKPRHIATVRGIGYRFEP